MVGRENMVHNSNDIMTIHIVGKNPNDVVLIQCPITDEFIEAVKIFLDDRKRERDTRCRGLSTEG